MAGFENCYFVLVRPNFLGNIGSIARVMKNFGFTKLRFVKAPKDYKDSEARRMAVDAIDVLKNSELFESLEEALADIAVAIGTTSCQQRQLEPVPIRVIAPELSRLAHGNKMAIVFGDERDGLTNAELARCHHIVTVPTNPDFAALNLAQAAGICAYEIANCLEALNDGGSADVGSGSAVVGAGSGGAVVEAGSGSAVVEVGSGSGVAAEVEQLSTGSADDILFEHLGKVLHHAGFTRSYNHDRVMMELRQFYQRAHATQRETDLLRGALLKLANIAVAANSAEH